MLTWEILLECRKTSQLGTSGVQEQIVLFAFTEKLVFYRTLFDLSISFKPHMKMFVSQRIYKCGLHLHFYYLFSGISLTMDQVYLETIYMDVVYYEFLFYASVLNLLVLMIQNK